MRVFLQSIVAQLLLNPYIYWRGHQALPKQKKYQIPYALFFILELSLFFFGFFLHEELSDETFITIMNICNTWYIGSLYITMGLLILEVIRASQRKWKWLPVIISSNWEKCKQILFVVFIFSTIIILIKGRDNVVNPAVRHVYIDLPKGSSSRDSLKMVMISDTHFGEVIRKKQAQRMVQLSNEQNPEIVVIVGDVLDYESRFAEDMHLDEEFHQFKAPLGVYTTYGNHEYRANRNAKEQWLRKVSTLLIDSVAFPDSSFYLIGRDDFINKKRKPLHQLMEGLDTTKPLIVLDHQPWSFAEMRLNKVDLGLHGHTHNGQYWPYPLVMKLIYECPYGYYKKGGTQHYVSSGYGCAGPAYRVGTHSELVVLHIRFV